MKKRVPPSVKTREAVRALIGEGMTAEGDPLSGLVQLSVRLAIEEALEARVRDLLGRGHYERRAEGQAGSRNGYREGHLKTSEGEVTYAVPQVREIPQESLGELRQHLRGRTEELERLGLEMYARGCSTRDIEALFRQADGRSLLSRTAVSEVTERLWEEYEEFATRDLSELRPAYLFVDGIAEKLRPGAKREAVLAAWAITWEGSKVLVHLAPGIKESTDCCREFFEDLKRRGLSDPVLVVSDGAPGLIRAIEECFPESERQRCLAHRIRNLMAKLPEEIRAAFKQAAKACYEAPSPAMAKALRDDLVEQYQGTYPMAVHCFLDDFEACIAHLRCPPAHRRAIRTTNLLERLFLEERRRVDAVGTMFGERPVLKLMYASLVRGSERWRGLKITEFEHRQLEVLHSQIKQEHQERNAPVAASSGKKLSTPSRVYSRKRT